MKRRSYLQLKAALLLIVFSMNIVIGFACAMVVDMGFNSKHQHDEEANETSVQVNGKEHQHDDKENKHHHDSKEESEKGGCCNDWVIKFQIIEKNVNQNNTRVIYTRVFTTIRSDFWNVKVFNCANALPQQYKANGFHPPPTDILIAIQRFQI